MTLPKIKQVRAWFTGGATAEKGAGHLVLTFLAR